MLEVEEKRKKKNKILFNRQSPCLQDLRLLIEKQNHRTIVLWIFDCVQSPIHYMKKRYPKEEAIQNVFEKGKLWAQGDIKMPEAKRAILAVHAMAKEIESPVDIALCHAIGQGIACIHTETHALGLMFYELTAVVLSNEKYELKVKEKIHYYEERLKYWEKHHNDEKRKWASFLLNDTKENRERLLHQKEQTKQNT